MKDIGETLYTWALGFVLGIFVGLMTGLHVGNGFEQEAMQDAAIAAQVTEWQIDPATGERGFVYLTPEDSDQ